MVAGRDDDFDLLPACRTAPNLLDSQIRIELQECRFVGTPRARGHAPIVRARTAASPETRFEGSAPDA